MTVPINEVVNELWDQPRSSSLMVSCYADTSVQEGFEAHWLPRMKTEARQIRQILTDDAAAREDFEANLDAIRRVLTSQETRAAQGMAIFSAAKRGFLKVLPADLPYEDQIIVGNSPYLVPLLEAGTQRHDYLVAVLDSHRARWYSASPGGAALLGEFDEEVPKKIHSSGDTWGNQQATIDRHRKELIHRVFKTLADRLDDAWSHNRYQGVILLGTHEILEQFRDHLPRALATRVLHEAPYAWINGTSSVAAKVVPFIQSAKESEQVRLLGELTRRLRNSYALVSGANSTLEALMTGKVATLLLGSDPLIEAWRCSSCRAVFPGSDELATCPTCQVACEPVVLFQEMLRFAIRHGVEVKFLKPADALDAYEGVAAFLKVPA